MRISKCDVCKKEVKRGKSIDISMGLNFYEFCSDCAAPVFKFLVKHKLIKKDEED